MKARFMEYAAMLAIALATLGSIGLVVAVADHSIARVAKLKQAEAEKVMFRAELGYTMRQVDEMKKKVAESEARCDEYKMRYDRIFTPASRSEVVNIPRPLVARAANPQEPTDPQIPGPLSPPAASPRRRRQNRFGRNNGKINKSLCR